MYVRVTKLRTKSRANESRADIRRLNRGGGGGDGDGRGAVDWEQDYSPAAAKQPGWFLEVFGVRPVYRFHIF